MTIGNSIFYKTRLHFIKNCFLLFTHGLTQDICITFTEICELLREQHYLLLINGNSVGFIKILLHGRKIILYGFLSIFTPNKARDILQRPWSVEGIHCNKIPKNSWFQLFHVFLHSCRFVLKNTHCFSSLK